MRLKGKLTQNSEGRLCIKLNLAQGGSEFLADVELMELLEGFLGKEVVIDILEVKKWEEL
jgi:hypothetical protein